MIRYLKRGSSFRRESTPAGTTTIRLGESGFAVEGDGLFSCGPLPDDSLPDDGETSAPPGMDLIPAPVMPAGVSVERMVLATGFARHSIDSDEEDHPSRQWNGASVRIHVSLTHAQRQLRCAVDLGGSSPSSVDAGIIQRVAGAMHQWTGERRTAEKDMSLSVPPDIAAAVMLHMADHPVLRAGLEITQSVNEAFAFDGYGAVIDERPMGEARDAPNFFRPTFRSRPVRAWFHLEAGARRFEMDPSALRAEALFGPVHTRRGQIVVPLFCRQPNGEVVAMEIDLTSDGWLAAVSGIFGDRTWFPYGAGVWGRTMLLRF